MNRTKVPPPVNPPRSSMRQEMSQMKPLQDDKARRRAVPADKMRPTEMKMPPPPPMANRATRPVQRNVVQNAVYVTPKSKAAAILTNNPGQARPTSAWDSQFRSPPPFSQSNYLSVPTGKENLMAANVSPTNLGWRSPNGGETNFQQTSPQAMHYIPANLANNAFPLEKKQSSVYVNREARTISHLNASATNSRDNSVSNRPSTILGRDTSFRDTTMVLRGRNLDDSGDDLNDQTGEEMKRSESVNMRVLEGKSMSDKNLGLATTPKQAGQQMKTQSSILGSGQRLTVLSPAQDLRNERSHGTLLLQPSTTVRTGTNSIESKDPTKRREVSMDISSFEHGGDTSLKGKITRKLQKLTETFQSRTINLLSPEPTSKRVKCQCNRGLKEDDTCSRALGWLFIRYRQEELPQLKQVYESILAADAFDIEPSKVQIGKDVRRTYGHSSFFKNDLQSHEQLSRVLTAFAKYDPLIGYVQGMNFLAGAFLFHAEEYISFWLIVLLFEIFELREIYMPRLPGLIKHCQMIDMFLFQFLPSLYRHFCKHHIEVHMYSSEWIFGLFTNVMPLETITIYLDYLIRGGWTFFYRLIVVLLKEVEQELLREDDMSNILTVLKDFVEGASSKMRGSTPGVRKLIDWVEMFERTRSIRLNEAAVVDMLSKFDNERLIFRL